MGRPWEKLLFLARGCVASAPPVEGPALRRPWARAVRRWLLRPPEPPYRHVCQVGEPALRAVAAPVDPKRLAGPEAQALVARLVHVMRAQGAVGLSAPQLGVPLQVLTVEFPERLLDSYPPAVRHARRMAPSPLRVFVNPRMRVLDTSLDIFPEGCLSVAGFVACVPRCRAVQIEGLNENGESVVWQASGWLARIIQHEMDHLQGCLFIDRMDSKTFTNLVHSLMAVPYLEDELGDDPLPNKHGLIIERMPPQSGDLSADPRSSETPSLSSKKSVATFVVGYHFLAGVLAITASMSPRENIPLGQAVFTSFVLF